MARGVNGYVTINVGVANGHTKVSAGTTLNENERNRRVRRLRKDGWSYRRIAATLEMSYASVCHLLDGDEARLPPSLQPATPPRRVASVAAVPTTQASMAISADARPMTATTAPASAARIEEMSLQIMVLQQRLDTVLALNEGHRQSLARLERSMVTTLENEHRALGQRLHAAVKTLLERMIPTSLRAWSAAAERTPDDQG
jgi:hypothetical protein